MKPEILNVDIYQRYASQINNLQAPGMPGNRVAIFVGPYDLYTESGKYYDSLIENYINKEIIPWAFMNGIYLKGMTHGNFVINRQYDDAVDVTDRVEEDYSLNVDVLNYVFACMAAANKHNKGCETITAVWYIGEEDKCIVKEFENEEAFTNCIKEELEYLEEE